MLVVATPATVCFAILIWRRSGDLVIDFGRELYVPWQPSQGRVLYRDLAYLSWPAFALPEPMLVEALWRRGRGAVMTGNAIVLVATVAALYRVLRLKLTGGDGICRDDREFACSFLSTACFRRGHGVDELQLPHTLRTG